ncbi:hypothetical protein BDQ17DRAFT_1241986 [Cyathus striatus]|nr:hypothetical protein BDQ17DRAFT_1241986 [Cyathus striatus]
MSSPKVWFVTGSSSGLGFAVVQQALTKGDNVVATLRNPDVISHLLDNHPTQLLIVKLDVTNPKEITSAFQQAKEKFDRVDIVYNNAAFYAMAEIEGTPDELARRMFEVNFWGAANVTREAVRFLRDVNTPSGGRILQASSMVGISSNVPLLGYYSATKFALEGFSEAISNEIDPSWNIKVTLISLGSYKTPATTPEKMEVLPTHPKYKKSGEAAREFVTQEFFSGKMQLGDSHKAAREIYKIAIDDDPPSRVLLGLDSIAMTKVKAELLMDQAEKSALWSADLK